MSDAVHGNVRLRHGAILYLLSLAITAVVSLVASSLDVNIRPNLAISLVLGLLFGPFACLGADTVSLATNLANGIPLEFCALDCVTTFLIAYLPHRLWYGTLAGEDGAEPPSLTTVRNFSKLVLIMVVCSLVYGVLYDFDYTLLDEMYSLDYSNLASMLSVLSFSLILGVVLTILFKYLGVTFWVPERTGPGIRTEAGPFPFWLAIAAALVVAGVRILAADGSEGLVPVMALTYALLLVSLTMPQRPAEADPRRWTGTYRFDRSLIERIIVITVVVSVAFSVVCGVLAYAGILEDVIGLGAGTSTVFYTAVSAIGVMLASLLFLRYVERRVSEPLGEISGAVRGFVRSDRGSLDCDRADGVYGKYEGYGTEIGVLAESLSEMTRDVEAYVDDIRELTAEQERYRAELSMARGIQESMVPREFSWAEDMGVRAYGEMHAAKEVGGDFFDIFRVDDRHVAVIVGDVSGKGMPAALVMASARYMVRGSARPGVGPDEVMSAVNLSICEDNSEGMFVTAWMGILDVRTGVMDFCVAGHNPPVLVRAGEGPVLLRARPCLVLGGSPRTRYRAERLEMRPGDRILLYTDGVTEANVDYQGFYGEERLLETVGRGSGSDVRSMVGSVAADVSGFYDGADQFDDATLFAVEYAGGAPGSGQP